ncbi:hypothetical protein PFY12_01650 [Chryseobacterium camelliae]|uniref:Lipocalin-like domain-containing protein n=1 Tax=Chryseobacterium camelliae TaxID=1265445 RepID=A0ABY7QPE1_9FLAO|nr:hypothetical protein [Chryseobacterium camelliae]WBV60837.1 hypothetical protein PFY12_01650 [Chryseobacterium camelliae]
MKKLFLVLAFGAGMFTATAQTKEETIKWLTEKLKDFGKNASRATNVNIKSIDECKIVVDYTLSSKDKQGKAKELAFEEILPTNINRIIGSDESYPGHFFYSEEIVITNFEGKFLTKGRTSALRFDDNSVYIPDVDRAIKYLATFCMKK